MCNTNRTISSAQFVELLYNHIVPVCMTDHPDEIRMRVQKFTTMFLQIVNPADSAKWDTLMDAAQRYARILVAVCANERASWFCEEYEFADRDELSANLGTARRDIAIAWDDIFT